MKQVEVFCVVIGYQPLTLKMEAAWTSETLVSYQNKTQNTSTWNITAVKISKLAKPMKVWFEICIK
jgi:hypothetical protein